jgi:PST family polysaccharide transporter
MTDVDTSDLGGKASRGAFVTIVGQLARILLQLVGVVVLARLLSPYDYGLVAMVTVVVGLGEVVRDFGLGFAAIQSKELSVGQRDNLFWINTGIGFVLSILLFGLSWPLAAMYDDQRVVLVAQAMSAIFLLNGLASQYRAQLQRGLFFGRVAVLDIVAAAVGVAVAVVAALLGAGYWALVLQQLVIALAGLLVLVVWSRWLPRWYRRDEPMRALLSFGWNVVANQSLVYASKNVDSLLIGITAGAYQTGLYNRAFQLITLPLNQLNAPSTRVAVPVLSRLQDEKERFDRFLLTGQAILLQIVLLTFTIMLALASAIVAVALGPQWEQSVPLLQILCIAGVFQTAGYVTYWVFLSKGLARSSLRYALVYRPILIACVLAGAFWGVTGVAWGYALGTFIGWPLSLWWLSRVSDAPVRRMFVAGARTMAAFFVAGVAAYAVSLVASDPWVQIGLGVPVILVVLAILALIFPPLRRDAMESLRTVRRLRRR